MRTSQSIHSFIVVLGLMALSGIVMCSSVTAKDATKSAAGKEKSSSSDQKSSSSDKKSATTDDGAPKVDIPEMPEVPSVSVPVSETKVDKQTAPATDGTAATSGTTSTDGTTAKDGATATDGANATDGTTANDGATP